MEIPRETDDYIRESIDHSVGLPVSMKTLLLKIGAVEASNIHLQNQYLSLLSKLKEKDEFIERSRAQPKANAVALRKLVEENQRLATKWERECSLYDHDREALMDFADEADVRAKVAEIRNNDLEEENKKLIEELSLHKLRSEQILLDSLVNTLIDEDEIESVGLTFLEATSGVEICQKLLTIWRSLRPSTHKLVALAAKVTRAEEEVRALSEENKMLNEENKRLLTHHSGSGKKVKNPECTNWIYDFSFILL